MRGAAILMVLVHNMDIASPAASTAEWLYGIAMHAGWIGVQLFFVLSGYLITDNLLRTVTAENYFRAFYARRALRIFPLYFGTLSVFFIVLPLLNAAPAAVARTEHHQIWLWLFLSNWAAPLGLEVRGFGHFWSLAIEEQFYLVWPLVVLLAGERRMLVACAAVVLTSILARLTMCWADAPARMVYEFTISRMDALAIGAAVAVMLRDSAVRKSVAARAFPCIAFAVVALATVFLTTQGFSTETLGIKSLGYTVIAACFGVMVAVAVATEPSSVVSRFWLAIPGLQSLGIVSFGMYVIHIPLHMFVLGPTLGTELVSTAIPYGQVAYSIAGGIVTYVLALLIFRFVEQPFLQLKDRVLPMAKYQPQSP
jgi:peptidoglycan/LPS O-acetylase OafA/YrhL